MAAVSYPDIHVTGAVYHFVRCPPYDTIYFLGTAEVTPTVQNHRHSTEVMNDIAGRSLPMQKIKGGESSTIGVLLNRFSKSAYDAVITSDATGEIRRTNGRDGRFSRGAPVFGIETFELWQVFENYLNAAFRGVGMKPGLYFPQVELVNHDRVALGTEAEKLLLVLDAQPYWTPQSSANSVSSGEREWFLYSDDPDDFPAGVLVPQ